MSSVRFATTTQATGKKSMSQPIRAIRSSSSERLNVIEASASALRARGLIHCTLEDSSLDGRTITLGGRRLVNFGSCSYLGLETDMRLKAGACEAIMRYGTQFSSSRAYVSVPLYTEYQALLSEMVGGLPLLIAPTTSLGHLAAMPVLIGDKDAVVYDAQVHASVQAVLPTLIQRGIPCEPVRHNRLDKLEERVQKLAAKYERVFYLCDGVYSMHGDVVDVDALFALLDRQPSLFAYVDDAHGVGWAGRHGAGVVLGTRGIHQRMLVTLGLAKSFATCGAAIVVPTPELAARIFTCGSTMIFSGPLQPAQLGAGIASAKIHLSRELEPLQAKLLRHIDTFDRAAKAEGLVTLSSSPSPIRFVEVGAEQSAMQVCESLRGAGYFVNVAVFPAVPRGRAGVRLMLNTHQTERDIFDLVRSLASFVTGEPESRKLPMRRRIASPLEAG
jgi:7-keto-8-aminopelargonate synthetase-like enzyme